MLSLSKSRLTLILVGIFAVSFAVGIIIGFFSAPSKTKDIETIIDNPVNEYYQQLINEADNSFIEKLKNEVNAENIKEHLRFMTNTSHMAGTPEDKTSADYVYKQWTEQNLDYVKLIDYDVLLSYPNDNMFNSLEIVDSDGERKLINITEPSYPVDQLDYSKIPKPFLAYSLNGSHISNRVLYADYCTLENFEFLKSKHVNFTDAIVICRYGKIFRGNKVKLASENGAKAVLIYDDPIRSAPANTEKYPNGQFLPESGKQRGSLFTSNGDPLTFLYPATENTYRTKIDDNEHLPSIVAQVIGYDLALDIFKMIDDGEEVDDAWKGAMDVKYTYGGLLKNNQSLVVNVYNTREIKKTYNVVGMIKGSTEPDRYVLVGNHRDSWVFGAIDPTSGTACLLEISRALNEIKRNKKWVPKRSIVFLSWGAEEFGLIGSTEWVEEFNKKLNLHSVAYLNLDVAVQGNYTYSAASSPLLFDLLYDVTKDIPLHDNPSTPTVFDRWLEYDPSKDGKVPQISTVLGAGSDHMAFQQRVGVPCIDATFIQDTRDPSFKLLGHSYATYHSSYETFNLVNTFIDPGFKSFKTITRVTSELARRLSDSLFLPFNCTTYGVELLKEFNQLKIKSNDILNAHDIYLDGLQSAINTYVSIAKTFHQNLLEVDKTQVNVIRQYNDQLKDLEKSFLDSSGVTRQGYLHMVSAPSLYDSYGGDGFPALADAIFNAKQPEEWDEVRKQLSIAIYVIQSASSILKGPANFDRPGQK